MSTLRVAADDKFGLRTLLSIVGQLNPAVLRTLLKRSAEDSLVAVVEMDVFVVAIVQAGADGIDKFLLTARLGFVVALGQEYVHIVTVALSRDDLAVSCLCQGCRDSQRGDLRRMGPTWLLS